MDFSADEQWWFAGMIFVAVFLLVQSFVIPVFGENRRIRKQMGRRLRELDEETRPERLSLMRQGGLHDPRFVRARWLAHLANVAAQAGYTRPLQQLIAIWLILALTAGIIGGVLLGPVGAVAGVLAAVTGIAIKVNVDRGQRIARFDEQLQDALGVMIRALRAGHPFNEAIRLVSEELPAPAGREFQVLFADINYGGELRRALLGLLARVPSVAVMAMVTAVLVQRETGGNLAETLEKIAAVIRGRFRFQRKVKTLSAEARMSAWILTLIPFALFIALSVMNPEYVPMLTKDAVGRQLIGGAFVLILLGIVWMRRIMQIKV